MILILTLLTIANANPNRPLDAAREPLKTRPYLTVDLPPDAPARARGVSRRGRWRCTVRQSGLLVRCTQFRRAQRDPIALLLFDESGRITARRELPDGPITVMHPQRRTVDRVPEETYEVGPWTLDSQTPLQQEGRVLTADMKPGHLRVAHEIQAYSVFSEDFKTAIQDACACIVQDRSVFWISDRPAVRYRLLYPHPVTSTLAELWATEEQADALVMTYAIPVSDPMNTESADLSAGRIWRSWLNVSYAPAGEKSP